MLEKKITFDRFIRFVFGLSIFIGILLLFDRLSTVLLPFFIAWLIAYFLYPLVSFFQYKLCLKSRTASILCAILVVAGICTGLFYMIVPPMIEECSKANDLMLVYLNKGGHSNTIPEVINKFINNNIDLHELNKFMSQDNIENIVKNAVPKLWSILSESLNVIFSIFASFIILLYVIFILHDYEALSNGWIQLVPDKYKAFISNMVHDLETGMNRYFRGQALVALSVAILSSIGFIIIDYPLAIGMGIFIGILTMIPYMKVIALFPALILGLLKAANTGQNVWFILLSAFIVFAVIQIIEDTILVPKIMGRITGLNPAIILLSLSIWGSLLGILGMIIALPITTLILSYYQRFIIHREKITESKSSDYQQTKENAKN